MLRSGIMAKFALVTLYDDHSTGVRIMSNVLKEQGHESHIIFFKISMNRVIPYDKEKPLESIILHDGKLMTWCPSGAPWSQKEIDLLIHKLDQQSPDIIGFSYRSIFDNDIGGLLMQIRKRFPEKVIIAGGLGPMLTPAIPLEHIDYVVFGEGEDTIVEIATAYDAGESMKSIPNLIYLNRGKITQNPVRPPVENLDQYPFPDYNNNYLSYIEDNLCTDDDPTFLHRTEKHHPVIAGRGCVGTCSYCSNAQWTKLYRDEGHLMPPRRLRSIDAIIDELLHIKTKGFPRIQFLDEFLVGPKQYMLTLFDRYSKEIGLPFYADLHPVQINNYPEVLDAACEAGLQTATVAIQHGSERFRAKYLNRSQISNQLMLKVARKYQERNVHVLYQLIAGIPFDTPETLKESFDFVAQLPMEYGHITVARLMNFPGSPLGKLIEEHQLPKVFNYHKWFLTSQLYHCRALFNDRQFNDICSNKIDLIFGEDNDLEVKKANEEMMRTIRNRNRVDLIRRLPFYLKVLKETKLYKNPGHLFYRLKILVS